MTLQVTDKNYICFKDDATLAKVKKWVAFTTLLKLYGVNHLLMRLNPWKNKVKTTS